MGVKETKTKKSKKTKEQKSVDKGIELLNDLSAQPEPEQEEANYFIWIYKRV